MTTWKQAGHRALYSGGAAALLSALTLAICGKDRTKRPRRPIERSEPVGLG